MFNPRWNQIFQWIHDMMTKLRLISSNISYDFQPLPPLLQVIVVLNPVFNMLESTVVTIHLPQKHKIFLDRWMNSTKDLEIINR